MPVAAAPLRTSASSYDTANGGPPAALGEGLGRDVEIPDVEVLVVGYLSAVAAVLHARGIEVATVALGRPERAGRGPRAGVLCGTLNLRPTAPGHGLGLGWGATQVDWHPDTGWSARLRRGINGHLTIWRYLHGALVPAPAVAAGFIAALGTADDVGQPSPAVFGERRRRVLTQLGRYSVDEPW